MEFNSAFKGLNLDVDGTVSNYAKVTLYPWKSSGTRLLRQWAECRAGCYRVAQNRLILL